ncbi:chromate efflux transporter [Microbacterium sp. SORGH_AS_0888]|uniref:chromate efflux transporter n=1 Tax=Microbacterium sp. SORGH_AS_0888 TaxID=3041791 RepID=UPI00278421D7|nr:chromate efflux transporter [Microbacterium sp. SORGH_AS_0888]MDQ1128145.1 chromate transporter [Microbacterium sp. SORGH_AS_0888]
MERHPSSERRPGSAGEVFRVFLKLGATSFGGPIAHLGHFRSELVVRRGWLDDREYGDLVALCQFLPGPASSQVGFAIGLHRAGLFGGLAAFAAFTLPSAALMVAFASGASLFTGPAGSGILIGLQIVAVAIVAQAVLGMTRTLSPDLRRASIAALAALTTLLLAGSAGQLIAIVGGAAAGLVLCRSDATGPGPALRVAVGRATGILAWVVLLALLACAPLLAAATGSGAVALFDAFFRSGALVFGGGHVVLPLLQSAVVDPGWVSDQDFLAGYGAAQALPGPLFTFSAYLGALSSTGPGGLLGAGIALVAIFLPGLLLLSGVLPFWNGIRRRAAAQAVMRGANAAVVGILAAALYSPLFTTAVRGPASFALALVCFVLLVAWRLPPWIVVLAGAGGGVLLAHLG